MELVLAQSSNLPSWGSLLQLAVPVLVVVIGSIAKRMKDRAAERSVEKHDRSARAALEMEAIRTGQDMEQVLAGGTPVRRDVQVETSALPESNDPKVRRERQLAELRRRAAARSGQTGQPAQPLPRSTARQGPMPTPSQPMPQLVRQPTNTAPIRIQLPGGGSIAVGQSQSGQSPASRPVARPQPKPPSVPQNRPQQQPRTQKMTNEQAARAARERQAVPTRAQNTQVSDMAGSSDTHRLVADTDAAKVTARAGRKGPKLGRAGLRQAMMMSEIFGKPRSERLDEI